MNSDIKFLFCTTDASDFKTNVEHLGWQVEQLVQYNTDLFGLQSWFEYLNTINFGCILIHE